MTPQSASRWISWTAAPEGDAFYAIGRDITVEKTASEALEQRFLALQVLRELGKCLRL